MTDTTNTPPLPEPDITSYQTDSIGRKYELRTFSEKRLRAYGDARAAHAVALMQGEPVAFCYFNDGMTADAIRALGIKEPTLRQVTDLQKAMAAAYAAPATAEQPQAREITDAEIDAAIPQEIITAMTDAYMLLSKLGPVPDDQYHIVCNLAAAIALAKGG